MSRKSIYLDPRWQRKRLEILQRADFSCENCHATQKTLHVHHVYYTNDAEGPWDYPEHALVALCDDCHTAEHSEQQATRVWLIESLALMGAKTSFDVELVSHFIRSIAKGKEDENERLKSAAFIKAYWETGDIFSATTAFALIEDRNA